MPPLGLQQPSRLSKAMIAAARIRADAAFAPQRLPNPEHRVPVGVHYTPADEPQGPPFRQCVPFSTERYCFGGELVGDRLLRTPCLWAAPGPRAAVANSAHQASPSRYSMSPESASHVLPCLPPGRVPAATSPPARLSRNASGCADWPLTASRPLSQRDRATRQMRWGVRRGVVFARSLGTHPAMPACPSSPRRDHRTADLS